MVDVGKLEDAVVDVGKLKAAVVDVAQLCQSTGKDKPTWWTQPPK
jgi:hypothetical protein